MSFLNDKKTFFAKLDKSKKGEIDQRIIPLLQVINSKDEYYSTSSCSGRAYVWQGSGKKNETQWIKVSHDLIDVNFLQLQEQGLLWLRVEALILHIACKDLDAAQKLLLLSQKIYKKSCLLTFSNKIIVEIRGSELIEMPLYQDGKLLFAGEIGWLVSEANKKLESVWKGTARFKALVEERL